MYVKENPGTEIIEKILNKIPSFVQVHKVNVSKLDSLVPGRNHQGIVALKVPSKQTTFDKKKSGRIPF
ncbi:RNA methyltransferase, TrmH family [Leptospira kirschneri serovar Mozdok]|nr:RNA methyltransferase, TrmH family [Leptospira kirschneri serovar Mozdok]